MESQLSERLTDELEEQNAEIDRLNKKWRDTWALFREKEKRLNRVHAALRNGVTVRGRRYVPAEFIKLALEGPLE